jgi:hypothetical protein
MYVCGYIYVFMYVCMYVRIDIDMAGVFSF